MQCMSWCHNVIARNVCHMCALILCIYLAIAILSPSPQRIRNANHKNIYRQRYWVFCAFPLICCKKVYYNFNIIVVECSALLSMKSDYPQANEYNHQETLKPDFAFNPF